MPIDPSIPLSVKAPVAIDPLEHLSRALQVRNQMQQAPLIAEHVKTAQLANQAALKQLDDTKALNEQMRSNSTVDPQSGLPVIDHGKIAAGLVAGGRGDLAQKYIAGRTAADETSAKLQETRVKNKQSETDQVAEVADDIAKHDYDPTYASGAYSRLGDLFPSAHSAVAAIQADPTKVKDITDHLRGQSSKIQTANAANAEKVALTAKNEAATANLKQTGAAKERQDAAALLGTATDKNDYAQKWNGLKAGVAASFPSPANFDPATTPGQVRALGMSSEQQQTAAQAKITETETNRHNLSTESTAKLNEAVNAGRLAQTQQINGLKYGPGTQEYWVKQLQDNPDSIKEMPAELRTTVGQKFRDATGLPLPTPLTGTAQTSETAARNSLDGIAFIKKALANPEIQKQIGPIMGRLGNAEQAIGTAVGLSPEAAQLAQELRTRLRYFVFQEGKAVLGGRLPQNLMKALEDSSANVKMDANLLHGALSGAEGSAQSILDNADKQRFGGKMRSRQMRGAEAALPKGGGAVIDKATAMKFYEAAGRDPEKANKLALENGWKTE